jgi:phage-related protein
MDIMKSGRAFQAGLSLVIFFVSDRGCLVLLHGFIKKTQKLPAADLALAKANRARYLEADR